jgi:hypothetical protein
VDTPAGPTPDLYRLKRKSCSALITTASALSLEALLHIVAVQAHELAHELATDMYDLSSSFN